MKKYYLLSLALAASLCSHAQSTAGNQQSGDEQGLEVPARTDLPQDRQAIIDATNGWWKDAQRNVDERTSWYKYNRFGCFVHWGVYSTAAGYWKGKKSPGYSEHLMRKERITLQEYKDSLVYPFNPVDFDADEWMRTVKNAGMKYFIITAKHHDGFAMYPSDVYPYDIRLTKYGKDPMIELRKATRKYGIKFGFYYSHAFDWEHPCAPGNDWEYNHPGGDKKKGGTNWWNSEYKYFLDSTSVYVRDKSIPQIQELIRNYHPDILWFDTLGKLPLYQNIQILKALRDADTNHEIVVNGRLVRFGQENMGDYKNTGDRAAYFFPVTGLWEAIPTTNESYGYCAFDNSHKSPKHFVQLLESAISKGGNILMNIGPMGNGKIDEKDVNILKGIDKWMKVNHESIYGNDRTGLPIQPWGVTTMKGDTMYVHVQNWPVSGTITIGGFCGDIKKAWMLADKTRQITWKRLNSDDLELSFKGFAVDTLSTVIALVVEGNICKNNVRLLDCKSQNILYTFDAHLNGKGLGYGDGKRNRNYVKNWKDNSQNMDWTFRLNKSSSYAVFLDYNTVNANDEGEVIVTLDGKQYPVHYTGYTERQGTKGIFVGKIKLSAGNHTCSLSGKSHKGEYYLSPIAVRLEKKK